MRRNKNDLFEKIEDDLRKIISYNTSVDTSSIDEKKLEERTRSLIRTLLFSILKNNRYDNSAFIEMINPHLSNPDLKKAINDYLLKPDYNNDKVITELILKKNEKNQEKWFLFILSTYKTTNLVNV